MPTEVLARKFSPALWRLGANGRYEMTDLYSELFHQYLSGELSQDNFLKRTDEIEAIYDGLREPFGKKKATERARLSR
jgi:hypothetical protein